MGPVVRLAKTAIALLGAGLLSTAAQASMVEMEDSELSEITGQAFINLTTDSANGLDFTRINFGLDMAAQLNIKKLQLGLYSRSGEVANSADIDINNFALGSVNDVTGQVSPFVIKNPFLELAYQGNKVVGVRLGFGEAQGYMSGDINRITGNVAVDLYGKGSYLASQMNCAWYDLICHGAKGMVGGVYANSDFSAQAQLVNGGGDPDPVRATMIGMVDGQQLSIPSGSGFDNFLLSLFTSNNCELQSTTTCFPLANYGSFPIGQVNPDTQQFTNAARGVFLSMQSQNVQWRDQQDASQFITALAGAFMNIPRNADGSAAINTSFQEAFDGIPRQDTCLGGADRGC
ncbi:DUF6160 family protein [Pseudomonas sp.]|uniref:DUF6160 family protein n=1 Tax=Pseudomonas sp. TaxID=306 RepID=UPI0027343221|nr:DUF6160 family protein [Pseudomonas sp.]MDP3815875.1 hypothetical protein [Pseudomonas sp.]